MQNSAESDYSQLNMMRLLLMNKLLVSVAPPTPFVLPRPLTTDRTVKAAASNLNFLSSSTSVVG